VEGRRFQENRILSGAGGEESKRAGLENLGVQQHKPNHKGIQGLITK